MPPTSRNLTVKKFFRLTPEESTSIERDAEIAGITFSEYVRRRIFGKRVTSHLDAQIFNELRRLGGLLKKIHTDSGGAYSEQTKEMLNKIDIYISRIIEDAKNQK